MDTGRFAGTVVLQNEEKKGLALMAALAEAQRSKAVIQTSKTANNSLAQAFRDNLVLDYAGIRASDLDAKQKQLLLDVVSEYVGNMRDGHAKVKMQEVRKHLDQTYFAWIGEFGPESVFYYRVHSPVVLIEFDHQTPVALPGPRVPGKLHIHSLIRTPNGNDYGRDLLRRHYERSHGLSSARAGE
jgi:predicted nuclease of restriction endonuclease-like (RecB) superfamily